MILYAIKIDNELVKVRGMVNGKGWLEWEGVGKGNRDDRGLSRPYTFCIWKERKERFPECIDATN